MIENLNDMLGLILISLIPLSYVFYIINQTLQKRKKKIKHQSGKYYREW